MSVVTNIILSTPYGDKNEKITSNEVNAYFERQGKKGFVSIDSTDLPKGWYGGSKYFEARIYLGAFNHLNFEEFMDHIKSLPWEDREDLQVIVKEQEDFRFKIISVFPEE